MMIGKTYVRIAAMSVVVLLVHFNVRAAGRRETTGHVIARDVYLGLPRTSSTVNLEVFILRTNESVKSRGESTHFLRVRYEDFGNQHPLPSALLEGRQTWRLSLKRDRSCDQVVSEGLIVPRNASNELPKPGTYVLLRSADVNDLPSLSSTMPCFILRPGGAEPVSSQP